MNETRKQSHLSCHIQHIHSPRSEEDWKYSLQGKSFWYTCITFHWVQILWWWQYPYASLYTLSDCLHTNDYICLFLYCSINILKVYDMKLFLNFINLAILISATFNTFAIILLTLIIFVNKTAFHPFTKVLQLYFNI